MPANEEFDAALFRRLGHLRLSPRGTVSNRPGTTPVPRATQDYGLEISRHRPYSPGNDLRHIDWNAYARLNEIVVRQFRAEREAPLHIVLDTSASMASPAGDGKFAFAVSLTKCLAYVALRQYIPVRVAFSSGSKSTPPSPTLRHPRRIGELASLLESLRPSGAHSIGDSIDHYLRSHRPIGSAVVLSDFLTPPAVYQGALERLVATGCETSVIRLLGPIERDPSDLPSFVRLRDSETGRERILRMSFANRKRYVAALTDHVNDLTSWCGRRGIPCAVSDPSSSLDVCLFGDLPRAGILS